MSHIPKPPDPPFDIDAALADLRLRDAAPALLAALKSVMPDLDIYLINHKDGPEVRYEAALAAIAQAEGS